jgi:4-diphosphocytidyl-2-C-methyl-D-erythritol kinase
LIFIKNNFKKLIAFPNAKINIGLNIVAKRPDGFHNIESVFYPIPWADALEISPAESTTFSSYGIDIPGGSAGNLCLKAYQLLAQKYRLAPVHIHLLKAIPIGAGLGGGSADAAFTLKLLNNYNKLNISNIELETYAKQLGSDCAFFVDNKPKYCYGRGDEFEEIALDLSGKFLLLVYPNLHVSTAEAYAGIKPQPSQHNLRQLVQLPVASWPGQVFNHFEASLFGSYQLLAQIKEQLYSLGASYASMTGSGSTIYGIFEQRPTLPSSLAGYTCFITQL